MTTMPFKFKKIIGCPMNGIMSMGKLSEKNKGKKCDKRHAASELGPHSDFVNQEFYEDPDLAHMRKTIEKNPEIFILNNLMMCVQFFENFEEEINLIRKTLISSREMQFNASLLPQKRTLLPDVLQEHIGHNLKFTSARQTLRPTIEPLQPIRVYVVHENFEIAEQHDPHHYTMVNDTVTYNLWLKPSEHKGFLAQFYYTIKVKCYN